jgi:hypothetical protein
MVAAAIAGGVLSGCGPDQPQGEALTLVVQRQPWVGPNLRGQQIVSENYRIYSTLKSPQLRDVLPGFMEASHRNYLRLTGMEPPAEPQAMPLYVMGSKSEWESLTRHLIRNPGQQGITLQAGGYCYKGVCVLFDMGGLGTLLVAAHEGCHQFLHHRLADSLPMWLEEGLCTVSEGYQISDNRVTFTPTANPVRFSDLRNALLAQRWIPTAELLSMDSGDALRKPQHESVGYYGQVWALVQFLRSDERYRPRLERMLADARDGKFNEALGLPPEALPKLRTMGREYNRHVSRPLFAHYITDDLETFDREYKAFARDLAGLDPL